MAEPIYGPAGSPIEVVPVVVLSQVFTARPSSIPEIRDFVRRCLAESPLTEEGTREVGETVFRALLDAAGPDGSIQVAFRIFPEHVEVDVLHSDQIIQSASHARPAGCRYAARSPPASRPGRAGLRSVPPVADDQAARGPAGPRRQGPDALDVRRLDAGRAAYPGPDPGGRGAPARCFGQDSEPLGWRRNRAAECVTCAAFRKYSARFRSRSPHAIACSTSRKRPDLSSRITGRAPTCVLRFCYGDSRWTPPVRNGSGPHHITDLPRRAGRFRLVMT